MNSFSCRVYLLNYLVWRHFESVLVNPNNFEIKHKAGMNDGISLLFKTNNAF